MADSGRAQRMHPVFQDSVGAVVGGKLSPNLPSSAQKTAIVSAHEGNVGSGGSRVYLPQIFWLETRLNGNLRAFNSPSLPLSKFHLSSRFALPNVIGLQFNQRSPNKVTYTIGSAAHVERQFIRDRVITMSGRTGVDNIWDPTAGKYIEPVRYFDMLRDAIECLHAVGSPPVSRQSMSNADLFNGQAAIGWRLILRSTFEEYNLLVEPVSFSYRRGGTSKFSFEWTLTLRAYSKFAGGVEPDIFSFPKMSVFDASKAVFKGARNVIFSMRNALTREVPGRLQALGMSALFSTVGTLSRLASPEREVFSGMSRVAKMWADALGDQQGRFDTFFSGLTWPESQDWKKSRSSADTARKSISVAWIHSLMLVLCGDDPASIKKNPSSVTSDFSPASDDSVVGFSDEDTTYVGPTRDVVALEGDTLESIAVRELNDEDWHLIAKLNKMKSPYKFLDGSNLSAGDIIKIPATGPQIDSFDPQNALGTDLLLGPDGDLMALNSDKDDVKLAVGGHALKQGLTHRLLVNAGDSLVFPSFGLEMSPGDPVNFATITIGIADIIDQVQSDPRIRSCNVTQALDGGDVMIVSCIATAKDGQETQITAPISI